MTPTLLALLLLADTGATATATVPTVAVPALPDAALRTYLNAASLQLGGLGLASLAVQYERYVRPRLSLASGVGVRFMSAGDYSSTAVAIGEEARFWFLGRRRGAMTGPYVGGRLDLAWTGVSERSGRDVGSLVSLTSSTSVGWRWVIARRVEVTPAVGLGLRTDFDPDGRLAPYARGELRLGLTAGWLF